MGEEERVRQATRGSNRKREAILGRGAANCYGHCLWREGAGDTATDRWDHTVYLRARIPLADGRLVGPGDVEPNETKLFSLPAGL